MRNFSITPFVSHALVERCKYFVAAAGLLILLSPAAAAQPTTTSNTDIATPHGLAAGAPAGSYQLSGFENVNLYNGNLGFHLPLIAVGGRGEAGFAITLSLNTKQWNVKHSQTETTETWYPTKSYWGTLPGYSAGVMQGRRTGFGIKFVGGCVPQNKQFYQTTLTTLTFTGPDGTEYEFRDQLNGGARMPVTTPCPVYPYTGASRGQVWITADGSAATFISDSVINDLVDIPTMNRQVNNISGYMLLRNGTRYRIDDGGVTWIRDRNGNMIFNNSDSLGRQFPITSVGDSPTYEDHISYKGFGGAQRVIRVTHDVLGNALRPGYSLHTPSDLFPQLPGAALHNSGLHNPAVITSVILPNGQTYQFRYNSYGELARVVLPTGGAIEYDMTPGSGVVYGHNGQGDDYAIYRRVVERRTYKDGSATPVTRTVYAAPADGSSPVEVKHYDGATLVASEKHYFSSNVIEGLIQQLDGSGFPIATYPDWSEAKETMVESYNTNGTTATTLLRRTVNSWQSGATLGGFSVNPRIASTTSTLSDTNQVTKQVFEYDQCSGCNTFFNNRTDVYEYDYGAGAPSALPVRRTHTDYVTAPVYTDPSWGPHIRSMPSQVSVFEGSIERSRTAFEYDNYADDANHKPLVDRPNISGLESTFQSTSYLARGNMTATTSYFFNSGGAVTGSVSGYAQYDIAGNVVKVIDGRGHAATLDFSDRFGSPDGEARANSGSAELNAAGKYSYAFATSVTNALNHTAYAQFDYYLGQPVDGEDINGVVASGYFNDVLDRPTQVVRANNQAASVKSQTTFAYDDTNHVITTTSDQNSFNDPNPLKSQILYDGLGRTTEKRQYESPTAYIAVLQTYDGLGRGSQTSNPYRAGESVAWTTTGYDALGRVISVTTPDSAVVSTSYSGNTVTVSDQAGKQRKSVTDALGRLKEIYEDPAGLNYLTSYIYDVLDNLITVNQGTQTRSFAYDSLKRLTSAANPESGTVNYQYDANGNLTKKTDARNVISDYTYDALNRNTSVTYSDGTPAVYRYYDGSVNGKGRLTWVDTTQTSASVVDIYDPMGRPVQYRQRFWVNGAWGDNFMVTANYNTAGQVVAQTYPSGRTVNYGYDGAGRLNSFNGNLGEGGAPRTYSTGVSYSPFGGMTQEQFGTTTPIYNKRHYNIRGQLYDVRASTFSLAQDEFNWNRGCLAFYYGGAAWGQSSVTNNGNVTMQQHFAPTNYPSTYSFTQNSYVYDSLNRLSSVSELPGGQAGPGSVHYVQAFSYDRYGNRTINSSATWGAGINNTAFEIDPAGNNRLLAPGDSGLAETSRRMQYDPAGNLKIDTYTGQGARTYDAENRMKQAQAASGPPHTYTYDGNGKRIKRNVSGTETWQVYGLGEELLAEYAANGAPSTPQKEYGYRNGELLVTAEAGGSSSQGGGSPYGGSAVAIPGTIEAENFDNGGEAVGYHDTTPGTHGQDYTQPPSYPPPSFRQPTDVDIYKSPGYSNNYLLLGQAGDWTNYTVNVASTGTYTMQAQVTWGGTSGSPGTFHVEVDGVDKTGPLQIPDANWEFTIVTKTGVQLSAGIHVMRIIWDTNAPNGYSGDIDYISFTNSSGGSPYGGSAVAIPGTIEAENFDNGGEAVGYHDTTPGTHGQDYTQPPSYPPPSFRQPTDVDIYKSPGYSNNYLLLGQAGDWTNYTVNVASTGTYTMQAQVTWGGTSGSPGTFHVEVDGVDKTGPLQIPDANWEFTIVTKTGVQLNAGIHVMRIIWDTNAPNGYSGDIDYLNFTLTSGSSTPVTNLALNKPATQVSTYDVAVASRAVDGNTDGNYGNNSVTHTLGGAQEWWQVDLGNSYSLQTIKLWNRTDCCGDRLSNFYVFVSDQPFTSYDLTTTLNQSGVSNYHTPGQGGTPTSITINRTGRYVRVQLVNPGLVSLAEVEVMGAAVHAGTGNIKWLVTDQLGTPRIILDQTGSLANISRHDYLPFGEEVPANFRTGIPGYATGDNVRQKFTGYEHDVETGLEFAQARYYASTQGRFVSVDPLMRSANIGDPQSFNRYTYVSNNPTNDIDPTGLCPEGKKCYYEKDENGKPVEWYDDEDGNAVLVTDTNDKKDKSGPVVVGPVVTAPPEIIYRFEYPLNPKPAPASVTRGGTLTSLLGRLLGIFSIVHFSAPSTGCGASRGGCPGDVPTMSEPDSSTDPDPEDNKPDTSENDNKKSKPKKRGNPSGVPADAVRLPRGQGWRDADGNIWKLDRFHKDHWDVSDRRGRKIKEIDFSGTQIWPGGPKNKNK